MPQMWEKWCRLCAEKANGPKIDGEMEEIIRKYFLGDIHWITESPKRVCRLCHNFLRKLKQFQARAARVQSFFTGLDFTLKHLPESKLNMTELRLRYGINIIEVSDDEAEFFKTTAPAPAPPPVAKVVAAEVKPAAILKVEEIAEEGFSCATCSRCYCTEEQLRAHVGERHAEKVARRSKWGDVLRSTKDEEVEELKQGEELGHASFVSAQEYDKGPDNDLLPHLEGTMDVDVTAGDGFLSVLGHNSTTSQFSPH